MNVNELHQKDKGVSAGKIASDITSEINSIRILAGDTLKKHITKVPAFLIVLSGKAVFEDVDGRKINLTSGSYVHIPVNVEHWIDAEEETNLILLKS